ncbi:MAG: RNA polymerase sigma factor [Bacteroidales bacterium]
MTTKEYNDSVEEYADNVYRFILSNLKDEELSRDIVQDTYERLWINHEKVDAKKVRSYLFTTAHNRMIDMKRKNKYAQHLDEIHDVSSSYHDDHYSDLSEVLNSVLNDLNETQRSVLLLRDYESYSYKEIAEITGLTESQVKVYIYRARSAMKEKIGSIEAII